jgi:hypothetical protein
MIGKDFVTAGNAIFTVQVNDEHFTYRINKPMFERGRRLKDSERANKPYFIGKLAGPDNHNDYKYLGVFNPTDFTVNITPKSLYSKTSKAVIVLEKALAALLLGDESALPEGWHILPPTHCGRCGRLLTVPESIENGIGPECFAKMGGSLAVYLGLDFNELVSSAKNMKREGVKI